MLRALLIALVVLTSVACATAIRLAPVRPGSAADPNSYEPPHEHPARNRAVYNARTVPIEVRSEARSETSRGGRDPIRGRAIKTMGGKT